MADDFVYMLGVVAVGFALNFGLRALPFVLFGRRNRELPPWVKTLSVYISPVIIAGLIVYAYSGSAWRTAWPYLAGALTVGLQIWKRNPLLSIIAGTALYMLLVNCCGCVTSVDPLEFDRNHPCVAITPNGVKFQDELVYPQEVPKLLKKHGVPTDSTIYILLDKNYTNERAVWVFQHNILGKEGYRRTMLVSERRAKSGTGKRWSGAK